MNTQPKPTGESFPANQHEVNSIGNAQSEALRQEHKPPSYEKGWSEAMRMTDDALAKVGK